MNMERQKLESLLIDYIDGKLNSVDKHYVEQELLKNPKSFKLYEELKEVIQLMNKRNAVEPSANLKESFQNMLAEEMKLVKETKVISINPWWYRVAAAVAFLVVGVSVGIGISNYNQRQIEIARINAEKAHVKELVTMIKNDQSAGKRILGLRMASEDEKVNDEILQALIQTLNEDENVNVKMAALEALRKFYAQPQVRKALIASLQKQTDPVIQIALIQILVELKEKGAIKRFKEITEDQELIPAVKDEAHLGIMVLS
jgi:hypothetical protein